MATLTSPELMRDRIVTELDEISDVTLLGAEPKDLQISPLITVHSAGTRRVFVNDCVDEFHRFWVTLYVRRDDAYAAEDKLNTLATAISQKLHDNHQVTGVWDDIDFDREFSDIGNLIVNNIQWRVERARVTGHRFGG